VKVQLPAAGAVVAAATAVVLTVVDDFFVEVVLVEDLGEVVWREG
jgi:hypothetical protein